MRSVRPSWGALFGLGLGLAACRDPGPDLIASVAVTPPEPFPDSWFEASVSPLPGVVFDEVRCDWVSAEEVVAEGACTLDGASVSLASGNELVARASGRQGETWSAEVASPGVTLAEAPTAMVLEMVGGKLDFINSSNGRFVGRMDLSLGADDIDVDAISSGTPSRGMPMQALYTPEADLLHVTSASYGVIWEIDPWAQEVLDWHQVSAQIYWISYAGDGRSLFLTDNALWGVPFGSDQRGGLSRVDRQTWEVTASVETGYLPISVEPDDRGRLFVTHHQSQNFAVVDAATMELLENIHTPSSTYDARVGPDGETLWVVGDNADTVWLYSLDDLTEQAAIPVGALPAWTWFDTARNKAWIPNFHDGTVSVVDLATLQVVATVETSLGSVHAVPRSDNRYLYVSNLLSDNLSVIDLVTEQVVGEWDRMDGPRWLEWVRPNP